MEPKPTFQFLEMRADRRYFTGEELTGLLLINNPLKTIVKEVRVILRGVGYITTEDNRDDDPDTNRDFAFLKYPLAGDGSYSFTLGKGAKAYPFKFQIRENLPPSFETDLKYGAIRYYLNVEILYGIDKEMDGDFTRITIVKPDDLNLNERLTQPKCTGVRMSGAQMWPWSWSCGSISGHLDLPRKSGFVPGETIDFRLKVENTSRRVLTGVKVSFERVITFSTLNDVREVRRTLGERKWPAEEVAQWENWIHCNFQVPDNVTQTNCGWDGRIDIAYCLHLVVRIKEGMSVRRWLHTELPIVIGTIPIRGTGEVVLVDAPMPAPAVHNIARAEAIFEPRPSTSRQAYGLMTRGTIVQPNIFEHLPFHEC